MGWKIPKMWHEGTCFIFGGGNSIMEQFNVPKEIIEKILNKEISVNELSPYFAYLHDKHVIGINKAYKIGKWFDIIYFGDSSFYLLNKKGLADYPNLVISCANNFQHGRLGIKKVDRDTSKTFGISKKNGKVSWNNNSGSAAISLACHLGVKKIVLLGFDMNTENPEQSSHWHRMYGVQKSDEKLKRTFKRHLKGFKQIAIDAKEMGVEIINLNPNSAINEFPKMSLQEYKKQNNELVNHNYVTCVLKSGGDFTNEYVYNLREMVIKNTTIPYKFRCFTDVKDLTIPKDEIIPLKQNWKGWWSKIEVFRNDVFSHYKRVINFDLDTVITSNIDKLFYSNGSFYMLRGFMKGNPNASGIMIFNEDMNWIYDYVGEHPEIMQKGNILASHQKFVSDIYLSKTAKRIEHLQDLINVNSYKWGVLKGENPEPIVCFHGKPRPHQVKGELKKIWDGR